MWGLLYCLWCIAFGARTRDSSQCHKHCTSAANWSQFFFHLYKLQKKAWFSPSTPQRQDYRTLLRKIEGAKYLPQNKSMVWTIIWSWNATTLINTWAFDSIKSRKKVKISLLRNRSSCLSARLNEQQAKHGALSFFSFASVSSHLSPCREGYLQANTSLSILVS